MLPDAWRHAYATGHFLLKSARAIVASSYDRPHVSAQPNAIARESAFMERSTRRSSDPERWQLVVRAMSSLDTDNEPALLR